MGYRVPRNALLLGWAGLGLALLAPQRLMAQAAQEFVYVGNASGGRPDRSFTRS